MKVVKIKSKDKIGLLVHEPKMYQTVLNNVVLQGASLPAVKVLDNDKVKIYCVCEDDLEVIDDWTEEIN